MGKIEMAITSMVVRWGDGGMEGGWADKDQPHIREDDDDKREKGRSSTEGRGGSGWHNWLEHGGSSGSGVDVDVGIDTW